MSKNATAGKQSPLPTREKILNAARELFSARGFKGTTTAAIARRARVNEALIYRHFPAKTGLYSAILRAKLADENLSSILLAAQNRDLPAEQALQLVAKRWGEYSDPEFLRLYYHSALEGHDLAREYYDQFVKRLVTAVEKLVRRGVRTGQFRQVDPRTAAQAFTGMLRSYCLTRELFPDHALKARNESVAATFCDLFLTGLRSPPLVLKSRR